MSDLSLFTKISMLPKDLREEVVNFLEQLIKKKQKKTAKQPQAGFLKGTFVMSDDFDEPLEDFKPYME